MKVLVTGATGLIGGWAARELSERGHDLRVLLRPGSRLDNLEDVPAERVAGDVTDRRSVEQAVSGCDAVLHAAGLARLRAGDLSRLLAVNRDGTVNVLEAALRAGVRRTVYISSVGAMGGTLDPVALDESWSGSAESSGVDYFVSKLEGERAAVEIGRRGLPLVVLRPGSILGPGDVYHSSCGLVLLLARGEIPALFQGGTSYADVRDVAKAQAEALERGRAGEVYVVGGHNVEKHELAKLVSRLAGVPAPPLVPYQLMLASAFLQEVWAKLKGERPRISRQLIRGGRRYTYLASGKAQRDFGYRTRPLEETVRDTLCWFLAHGDLEPITPELRRLAARAPSRVSVEAAAV